MALRLELSSDAGALAAGGAGAAVLVCIGVPLVPGDVVTFVVEVAFVPLSAAALVTAE